MNRRTWLQPWSLGVTLLGLFTGGCAASDGTTGDDGVAAKSGQPLYVTTDVRLWTENNNVVPICYTGAQSAQFADQKGWITTILRQTWGSASSLAFTFSECPTTGSTRFLKVNLISDGRLGGFSQYGLDTFRLPSEGAMTEFYFNPGKQTSGAYIVPRATVEWIAVHEIGHALGFVHEFERPDFPGTCNGNGFTTLAGAVQGPYDGQSVLGYEFVLATGQPSGCRTLAGGLLSDGDRQGASQTYSRPGPQVLGVTNNGALKHALRRTDRWFAFGDVEGQAGEIGVVIDANMAYMKRGASHVVAINSTGRMFYSRRDREGVWTAFEDVNTRAGFSSVFSRGAVIDIADAAHVLGIDPTGGGTLRHAVRAANGSSWGSFGNVETEAGDIGMVTDAAGASFGSELHVCAVSSAGVIFHTIRRADGTWSPFRSVNGNVQNFRDVDCTNVSGNLHLTAVTASGGLWHNVRRGDTGAWLGFANIKNLAGDPGVVLRVAAAQWAGRLYVTVNVGSRLFQTERRGDNKFNNLSATWSAFVNVNSAAGNFGFVGVGMD